MESKRPIVEVPWHLDVNGTRALAGTFTPDRPLDLAAGRLLGEGFIAERAHLLHLDESALETGAIRLEATVDPDLETRARAELRHRSEHGCGLLHYVVCDGAALGPAPAANIPSVDDFRVILRDLFAACAARFPRGGVHAAALWDGETLRHQSEDVGRHNAVDRVLGAAFLEGTGPRGLGLVLTARVSGQMAMVAARTGVAWIASRSVPTGLAIEIARAARLPILQRAAREARRVGGEP
ncbi:MAG: formate dehydrogenase accessory sulfurtransferase FdhD [Gemmatimonadota bacterium]|jgi:FdhD protein